MYRALETSVCGAWLVIVDGRWGDGYATMGARGDDDERSRGVDVESRVGDSDPVKAIEDALRTFSADELIVVTLPDEDATWLEKGSAETALKRFSLPVTHLVVRD
jgi:hypothetical protein